MEEFLRDVFNEIIDEHCNGKVDSEVEREGDSGNKIENLKVSLELGYDAIFIPGIYDKVGLIIPQLAFYNIENTKGNIKIF